MYIYYDDGDTAQWIDAASGILDDVVSYWTSTNAGINTLRNVGIGTTNPRYLLEVGNVGYADTALWVNGNARVTGILSVGQGTVTLDGSNNTVNVGTALTLGHTQGIQFHTQSLHTTGLDVLQVNSSGIITATSLYIGSTQVIDGSGDWTGNSGAQGEIGRAHV